MQELRSLRIFDAKDGVRRYMKKVRFYANFDLLCIDALYRKRKSFLFCTQCDVSRLPEMIANTSMGEALRGRIQERAKVVSITGPELRLLDKSLPSDKGYVLHSARFASPQIAVHVSFSKRRKHMHREKLKDAMRLQKRL